MIYIAHLTLFDRPELSNNDIEEIGRLIDEAGVEDKQSLEPKKEKDAMTEEHIKFADAVRHATQTFNDPKHKRKLRDLSPRFWIALLDLELACEEQDWDELKLSFKDAYRFFGAPGDFGYGTPCGDALRAVYDTWNVLCAAKQPELMTG